MSTALEPRVSDLEKALKELAYAQLRTERSIEELSNEMSAFKNEMSDFKNEMIKFKNEMSDFKNEARRQSREMNRRWGELANRLGTLVEDIVAPNIPGILSQYFGVEEADFMMIRPKRKHPDDTSRRREFDVIAITPTQLFLNETKSRPRREDISAFAETYLEVIEFFPEYADRNVVPIFSALYLDDALIALLTKHRIYALSLSDDTMVLRNYEAIAKR